MHIHPSGQLSRWMGCWPAGDHTWQKLDHWTLTANFSTIFFLTCHAYRHHWLLLFLYPLSMHIAYISRKAGATVGFLRRNLRNCPKECRRLAYITLVRSRLEYAEQCGTHTINRTSRSWKECKDRQPASSQKTTGLKNRVAWTECCRT